MNGIAIPDFRVRFCEPRPVTSHPNDIAVAIDNLGGVMEMVGEKPSLEAEIADCCQAMYSATESEVAMRKWQRLRELVARRDAEEEMLFRRESRHRGTADASDMKSQTSNQQTAVYSSWRRRPA